MAVSVHAALMRVKLLGIAPVIERVQSPVAHSQEIQQHEAVILERSPQQAPFQVPMGGGVNAFGNLQQPPSFFALPHKVHILHEKRISESPCFPKDGTPTKKSLVSVGKPKQVCAKVCPPGNQIQGRCGRRECELKTADGHGGILRCLAHKIGKLMRGDGVVMEEQEDAPFCRPGACIELNSPPPGRDNPTGGGTFFLLPGRCYPFGEGHDDFIPGPELGLQKVQKRADGIGGLNRGDDDGKPLFVEKNGPGEAGNPPGDRHPAFPGASGPGVPSR